MTAKALQGAGQKNDEAGTCDPTGFVITVFGMKRPMKGFDDLSTDGEAQP